MGFTQEQLDRQAREMNQRLREAYGEALEPMKQKFLDDPRTKAYLYNDSDRGITVDPFHPSTIKIISGLFSFAADPAPPYGQRSIDLFVDYVLYWAEGTPDGGASARVMVDAMHEHIAQLKGERARHLH